MKKTVLALLLLAWAALASNPHALLASPAGRQDTFPDGTPRRAIQKSPPDTTASEIPGVVAAGAKVQLVRDLFQNSEGPIAMPDGSMVFSEQDANNFRGRLIKIDKDGSVSTFLEDANRTLGLASDSKGRLIATHTNPPGVSVLHPTRTTLASEYGGQPLVYPNDLVIDKKGGIYFTDQINSRFRPPPPGRTPLLLYIRPDGQVVKASEDLSRPNGIMLSPDEKVLYAVNGPVISAFDVQPDGSLRNFRTFADGGGDSMCVDSEGRLYVAMDKGVRVHSPQGELLGMIPTPMGAQAAAFAGPDKKTLYIVGNGAVWKVATIAQGYLGRPK